MHMRVKAARRGRAMSALLKAEELLDCLNIRLQGVYQRSAKLGGN